MTGQMFSVLAVIGLLQLAMLVALLITQIGRR